MIVAFLLLYCYSAGAWKYVKKTIYTRLFGSQHKNENESPNAFRNWIFDLPPLDAVSSITEEQCIRFYPPVFEQRYWTVAEVLKKVQSVTTLRKVADLGCSKMAFFHYLKNMEGVEEIVCVDVDEETLSRYASRTTPFTCDFLNRRETPLKVTVLNGDASAPDRKLEGTNVVVAIELIEHLYPKTLDDLPYAVFGLIQPDLAIFTTPNCEFNVVFPNFSGLRHDDHKFEWSREQFKDWGCNLIERYPDYEVFFKGIGPGPEGTEQFGLCSQMAVFIRKKTAPKKDTSHEFTDDYKIIQETEYPVRVETRTVEEIIQNDAEAFIRNSVHIEKYLVGDRFEIPIKDVMEHVSDACNSDEMLRELLSQSNWKIEKLPSSSEYAVILPESGLYSETCSDYSDFNPQDDYCSFIYNGDGVEECWDQSWEKSQEDVRSEEETKNGACAMERPDCWPRETGVRFQEREDTFGDNSSPIESERAGCQNGHIDLEGDSDVRGSPFCQIGSSLDRLDSFPVQNGPELCVKNPFASMCGQPLSSQPVMRCRSFEQINKRGANKNKIFRYSLCDEEKSSCACDSVGAKNVAYSSEKESSLEEMASGASCSDGVFLRLEDSCSQSKAGDSGYPNSCERDMDMDLTPEQVDEIVTESESSFEEGDDEESVHGDDHRGNLQRPQLHQVHWIDNMENGDVANNNRDWEGNNMEAEAQIGEALQFENVIDHRDFAVPLMDAVAPEVDSDEENRFVSASEFFNSSDDTIVGSLDSLNTLDRTPSSSIRHCFDIGSERRLDYSDAAELESVSRYLLDSDENAQGPSVPVPRESSTPELDSSFPPWLLQIMLEEENDNGGEEEMIPDEDDEVVMTVEGDLVGGGEPTPNN